MTNQTDTLNERSVIRDEHRSARVEYETPKIAACQLRHVIFGGLSGVDDSNDENNTQP